MEVEIRKDHIQQKIIKMNNKLKIKLIIYLITITENKNINQVIIKIILIIIHLIHKMIIKIIHKNMIKRAKMINKITLLKTQKNKIQMKIIPMMKNKSSN